MREGTTVVVVGAVALGLLYIFGRQSAAQQNLAASVALGRTQIVPQAASNYSGYLAASTAPAVSTALNGFLTGLGNLGTSWLHGSSSTSVGSPSAAQPQGAQQQLSGGVGVTANSNYNLIPPISPIAYDNTSGSAFNYQGLSYDNGFDPTYSMEGYDSYGDGLTA
jgi:hypothetical protein